VPGLSRLVRVHFLDPVERDGSTTMAMRWEATGITGRLFPVLNANTTLTAAGDQSTQMTLTGAYRSRWAHSAWGWIGRCCTTSPPRPSTPCWPA
jgi:hypothetical protein